MHVAWIVVRQSLAQTKGRLALITGAVAFGTVLLLAFAAFTHATFDRTAESWQEALHNAPYVEDVPAAAASSHIKMYRPGIDDLAVIGGAQVEVLYVDAAGVSDPAQLHGITWPGRGEYLLSRGTRTLLETSANPAVAGRFGTTDRGMLPQEFTNGPDDLLAVVGADLSEVGVAHSVASFEPAGSSGSDPNFILLLIGLVVLLFPVLFLISISAALGSAQREQRYATLRLVGATTAQVRGILILEALVGAAVGYVLGAALFVVARPLLAEIPLARGRYWAESLAVTPLAYALVALAIIVMVVGANLWGLRRIDATPLGVVRRRRAPTRPSPLSFAGIALACAIFGYLYVTSEADNATNSEQTLFLAAVVIMMFGLVVAARWLIYALAGLSARWARRAPMIIGQKYVRAHSGRIARSVSGVILALFAGTFFITTVSEVDFLGAQVPTVAEKMPATTAVLANLSPEQAEAASWAIPANVPGARALTVPYLARSWVVLPCDGAERYVGLTCQGSGVVGVNFWDLADAPGAVVEARDATQLAGTVQEEYSAHISGQAHAVLLSLREPGDIEAVRTILMNAQLGEPGDIYVFAGGRGIAVAVDKTVETMTYLVYAGIALTFAVAIVSLLVSTYAGLLERRRSLLTLRLSGMQVRQLAAMLVVESVLPLAVIATLTTAAGFGSGWLLMEMRSTTLDASFSPVLLLALLAALGFSLLAVLALVPALRRVSEPANNARE